MEGHLTFLGNSISDRSLELGCQRQHCTEDLADRSEIIIGDPAAQTQEFIIQRWRGIERRQDIFGGYCRLAIVEVYDNARHTLLSEWNKDASADHRDNAVRNAVRERHIQRHGN